MAMKDSINPQDILKIFEKHGYITHYFANISDANSYFESAIRNKSVGAGGSVTIAQMGLLEILSKTNKVYSHGYSKDPSDIAKAATADVYLTSANAISATGEIVNIDGRGNRISATLNGPSEIYFICGTNKIEPDLTKALWRAKNIAAPKNAQRLRKKTPCAAKADKCYNCASPDRICRATCIYTHPLTSAPAHIVLIDEPLGY